MNRDVSSAKSFALDFNTLEYRVTPAKTGLHDEICPFKITVLSPKAFDMSKELT